MYSDQVSYEVKTGFLGLSGSANGPSPLLPPNLDIQCGRLGEWVAESHIATKPPFNAHGKLVSPLLRPSRISYRHQPILMMMGCSARSASSVSFTSTSDFRKRSVAQFMTSRQSSRSSSRAPTQTMTSQRSSGPRPYARGPQMRSTAMTSSKDSRFSSQQSISTFQEPVVRESTEPVRPSRLSRSASVTSFLSIRAKSSNNSLSEVDRKSVV